MSLGTKLKELRTNHKLTLEEMANQLNAKNPNSNFNKGRLSKWEHARSILEIDISTFLAVLCAKCVQIK